MKEKLFILSLISILLLSGCAIRNVILHPIEKTDIFYVPEGTQIAQQKTEKDGYFLSKEYMEQVIRARLGK